MRRVIVLLFVLLDTGKKSTNRQSNGQDSYTLSVGQIVSVDAMRARTNSGQTVYVCGFIGHRPGTRGWMVFVHTKFCPFGPDTLNLLHEGH